MKITTTTNHNQSIKKTSLYLDKLVFKPEYLKGFVANYIKNSRLVMLLLISIVSLGIISYFLLPQRLNPEIKIPIVTISTLLPGASPTDVESLITRPIEDELRNVKNIEKITSSSVENVSITVIQFDSKANGEKAKNDVQSAIDSITNLPGDAKTPNVKLLDFEDQPIWVFSVSTNSDIASLMNFSNQLKDKIKESRKIDRIELSGFETKEIIITMLPEKLKEYNINPLVLTQIINKAVKSYPAGNLTGRNNTFSTTVNSQVVNIEDIRNQNLIINNQNIRLKDIANVSEKSIDNINSSYIAKYNSDVKRSVVFYVYKTTNSDIIQSSNEVKKIVETEKKIFKNQFEITTIINTADEIQTQMTDLLGEFRSTIILVSIALLLFLGIKQALLSSLTIPLTFLASFALMNQVNMSINFISLFAFLLSLGLLVDDTIVVISAMTRYYRTGRYTPLETGILVWKDTIVPIWSTTITTIWSFIPLLLSTGIMGEFIKPIPVVVTTTMVSSTAIAVLITLPFMIVLLKPSIPKRIIYLVSIIFIILGFLLLYWLTKSNVFFVFVSVIYITLLFVVYRIKNVLKNNFIDTFKKDNVIKIKNYILPIFDKGIINLEKLENGYYHLMLKILNSKRARRTVIILIISYAFFSFMLLPLGFVKNEFFPKSDNDYLYMNLDMPTGTKIDILKQEGEKLLLDVKDTLGLDFTTLEIGKKIGEDSMEDSLSSVLFTLHLPEKSKRKTTSIHIAEELRKKYKSYTTGKIQIIELSGGPPAGADINIKLLGPDLRVLEEYSERLVNFLNNQNGVINVDKSIKMSPSKIVFVPDNNKLIEHDISIDTLGLWLRIYASGIKIDELNLDKTSTEKEDITFKLLLPKENLDALSLLEIPTNSKKAVSILSLGSFVPQSNPSIITREDYKRTMSVSAAVKQNYSISDINKNLEKFADTLNLPNGYSWKTGGVNEENNKSITTILQAMVLAFILILITMVVQFNSYRQAVLVLLVIPLAVSSVFLAFALTNTPLSFPALIGVLSLFGIVVTNSMFIVDKINLNLKEGLEFKTAIANAGSSRMEPIILTKLCTILGLLPISISNPMWRGLGGAIISGLLIASSIMLFFLPVVYYNWFNKDKG